MQPRLLILGILVLAPLPAQTAEKLQFNRDIRPILSESCFACHGPDKNARQADLRLDVREAAVTKGAIQPSDAAASKLVARIRSPQEALRMPPVWSDKKLSEEQKTTLVRWIEEGAEYEQHWAYIPPVKADAPEGPAAIDFLINRKLEEKGLAPVEEASRRVLARRASFDLRGLPPTPAEVDAFINDASAGAYERYVDKLLASPHYGERMAIPWLDLVRYADTIGFHSDVPVGVSPYRDYVIRAFNENKPFDEFTREQLAGDLLANPTSPQKVAAAYNRLNRITNEGGAQAEEYLVIYAADRVRTVTTTWLGSTVGCAQCHDHKFDPFATKDFYQFAAFFADIEEKGVYGATFGADMQVLSPEAEQETLEIQKQLDRLRADGDGKLAPDAAQLGSFRSYLRNVANSWQVLEPDKAWDDCSHPDLEGCEDLDLRVVADGYVEAFATGDKRPSESLYEIEISLSNGSTSALMLELAPSEDFTEFGLSEFEVRLLGREEQPIRVEIGAFVPDWEDDKSLLRTTADGNHRTAWRGDTCAEGVRRAVFVLAEPLETHDGERLRITTVYNDRPSRTMAGRFRLHQTAAEFPELPPSGRLLLAARAEGELSEQLHGALLKAFDQTTSRNSAWREIRALERRKKALVDRADSCLMVETVREPRTTRILPRGDWMNDSGEIVEPQAPYFLKQIPTNGRRLTRLDLADWLVDRDNPLTARVFVNRLWKMYFGAGLSKNLDDVGSQGETPLNQELLDWLAVEFMDSGWDIKHIGRTMLLSDAYRRSSAPTDDLSEADPYNRLHGRQSIARLDAELIRDSALAVSGLLNPKIGGRSVRPYQPEGYYKELNFPKREYEPDYDQRQFRRGLYTHWQRTFLHPSLMAFDAPVREECTAERSVSNTPLQSLALLNDPTYVEAARAFALRMLRSDADDDAGRIDFAFREAFSRHARPAEQQVLRNLLTDQTARFAADPETARAFLSVGIRELPDGVDPIELAAWSAVARALLNKHELLMRY